MTRLCAAGTGPVQGAVEASLDAKHEVAVYALSARVEAPSDADHVLLEDYDGVAYDVHASSAKTTTDAGKTKTVEVPPPPPGHAEFMGLFARRGEENGAAYAIAQKLLVQPNMSVVIVDHTKQGRDLPRFLARVVAWYAGRRNLKLAKALKKGVPMPSAEWAREAIKVLEATKTRAGLVEKMETFYLEKLAHLV